MSLAGHRLPAIRLYSINSFKIETLIELFLDWFLVIPLPKCTEKSSHAVLEIIRGVISTGDEVVSG